MTSDLEEKNMQKTKKIALILAIFMVVSIPAAALNMNSAKAQTGPTVSLSSAAISGTPPAVGKTFTVTVQISNATNVWSYKIGMTWNSSVLQMVNITNGGWFESQVPLGTLTLFVGGDINNSATPGSLDEAGNVIFASMGANGSGNLAVCTFLALTPSQGTPINLTTVLQLPDSGHPTIEHTDVSALARVTLTGDINGDFIVNILDAIVMGNAFGARPGNANWNANADLNGDGIVNILDAIIMGLNFLKRFP
jgi:hypothetical protein